MSNYVTKTNLLSALGRFKDNADTLYAKNAVVTQELNTIQGEINQHDARITNLEQKAGDYSIVQYRGTNAVPTGKAKYGLVKEIVGKTRAWNQLSNLGQSVTNSTTDTRTTVRLYFRLNTSPYTTLYNLDISQVSAFSTIQTASFSGSVQLIHSGATNNIYFSNNLFTAISGHKYLLMGNMTRVDPTTVGGIVIEDLLVRDLTLIFGSGNEPSTVAEALAQLPALGQYNAYDAGSLVDTVVSGVESVGVNIWDEEWVVGGLNADGTINSSETSRRTSTFIPVISGEDYYLKCPSSAGSGRVAYYDHNKNMVSYNYSGLPSNQIFTINTGVSYVRITFGAGYGITYNHDIQISKINGSVSTVNTTYHPYKTDTLSLSETVTLREDDELTPETGAIVRKMVRVNLSDYDWTYANPYWFMADGTKKTNFINMVKAFGANVIPNWISANLEVATDVQVVQGQKTYAIGQSSDNSMLVNNGSDTTPPSGALVVELATPTTESIDPVPDNTIYTEGGGTIRTNQSQSPVIDNCLDVGYLAV